MNNSPDTNTARDDDNAESSSKDPAVKNNNIKMAEENWGEEEWGGDDATSAPAPIEVQVIDISLTDYIAVKEKHAVFLPHTAGRYAQKRFRKAQCPIVERLTNSLMMHGRNNGK